MADEQREPWPPVTTAEAHRLWREVLSQALDDALHGRVVYGERCSSAEYVDTTNPDFCRVCENAGFDPAYVVRKFTDYTLAPQEGTPCLA